MTTRETRFGIRCELREDDNGDVKVEGYAAVFNQRADIGGLFTEEFKPGAFADAIGRDDVVFLVNHDGLPLARTRSGTLALSEDKKGLKVSTTLDGQDPDVKAIVRKMKRGDLDKMSIAFIPQKQEWDDTEDTPHRVITQASLYDVSVVTTPAYDGTEIALRSLDELRKASNHNSAARRVRMKLHLALRERERG